MKKKTIRHAWEHIKLMGTMIFAMAAGAASYHQLEAQHKWDTGESLKTEVIREAISQKENFSVNGTAGSSSVIYQVHEMTEEEIREEEYYDSLELLAICVEAEAGNQGLIGKRMVADVILNRVDDPDFPDTITGVITQKNQFSSYWDGGMDRVREPSEETIRAVQMELKERGWPELIYFTAGSWPNYGTPWKQVGDHFFNTK